MKNKNSKSFQNTSGLNLILRKNFNEKGKPELPFVLNYCKIFKEE